ncbi:HD domain-containing protein [Streptomyces sp. WMMC940]|uniref:HD domain-containing protein n=1 Tax=Streptomyces sp. WMMC940 TaxID=3015153 RepID=UPI0022B709BE|nr:HD domain-containing protein [Streptomyces sp. WMMC940]MCZ7459541.1 HD domain-containing protein [Streptomyces sp. WMMC940]
MPALPQHPAHADLRRRWAATVAAAADRAPDASLPGPDRYADDLLGRWAEPQRRYHTTDHLVAVLEHIDTLAAYADDIDLVRLAAWFHDAVYLPERSTNEERSARLAERALPELGVGRAGVEEVSRLVLLTRTHTAQDDDANGKVLCDADLAVLASPPDAYERYAAAVREEYGFVPDDAFRAGRADVLRHLLGLPRLFRTPYGQREWEEAARRNAAAELRRLVHHADGSGIRE